MSITIFLAFCILGCDFLLYVLYQWIYGEKRKSLARDLAKSREEVRFASHPAPFPTQQSPTEEPRHLSFPPRPLQQRTGYY